MAPLQKASSSSSSSSSSSDHHQTIIHHFTHTKHPLQRFHIQAEYSCDGCSTLGGAGFRYRCSAGCDFDLHEHCAASPLSLSSNLHPNHHLILVNQPGNGLLCNCCRQLVNGLFYTCRPCNVHIHPICTQRQVPQPTGPRPSFAARPTVNWAASQAPASPWISSNGVNNNSHRLGVMNQGFQNVQPYNNNIAFVAAPAAVQPYNNNGFVAATAANGFNNNNNNNRQTNNTNNTNNNNNNNKLIGNIVRKVVTTSIFGVPL